MQGLLGVLPIQGALTCGRFTVKILWLVVMLAVSWSGALFSAKFTILSGPKWFLMLR